MDPSSFNQDLLDFLYQSPTPFHAVASLAKRLEKAGFQQLNESESWKLESGGKYFVTRNDSSIIAFVQGTENIVKNGIRMVGAHTDSPCLRVKPAPEINSQGYFQLGVETYGGVLLNPWFDRDLSLAGRVTYKCTSNTVKSQLINFIEPIATIPSLAIHLDREANKSKSINAQTDIPPILMQLQSKEELQPDFRSMLARHMQQQGSNDINHVLDYELSFYDTQKPAVLGFNKEFIASARLDNLLSCFVGMQSLLQSDGTQSCLLVCNDHEEIGSRSACGAQGPMLENFLTRLIPDSEERLRCIDSSMMISADNAHGIHPNFSNRHDSNHGPVLNRGPVIKVNANQSYATNSETSALFRHWCETASVPVQVFVTRTDQGCGSTIGPITASSLGIKTLDVGVPTFGMHSIRELAGTSDSWSLYSVLNHFFASSMLI